MKHKSLESLIKERRTIQEYTPSPLSDDVILKGFELSLYAPNHKLTFPWKFFWLGEKSRRALAELSIDLQGKKKKSALSDAEKDSVRKKFAAPAALFLVGIGKSNPEQEKEDYASLACALQNLALYFTEIDIGTKWGTGAIIRDPRTYELIGESASEVTLEGLFWIGKALRVPPYNQRPPLQKFLKRID